MKPLRTETRPAAFTLVELLTVIAIISLLIGLLLPSLSAARDQAKAVKTQALLKTIDTGLEMFKNENEKEFRASNGYPPSAGYRLTEWGSSTYRKDVHESFPPPSTYNLTGAHWLPRMLMGKDMQGFVRRQDVPEVNYGGGVLKNRPDRWYEPEPAPGAVDEPLRRVGPYLKPDGVQLAKRNELPGAPDDTTYPVGNEAPVIVDVFNHPVLYYVANPMVAAKRGRIAQDVDDPSDPALRGIYNFLDNEAFTGNGSSSDGFDFGAGPHWIKEFGNADEPDNLGTFQGTFVSYIHDHRVGQTGGGAGDHGAVAPYNRDTFLLITAGKDGIYGSRDDVSNFERQ